VPQAINIYTCIYIFGLLHIMLHNILNLKFKVKIVDNVLKIAILYKNVVLLKLAK
jgi:intracellular septation protein A